MKVSINHYVRRLQLFLDNSHRHHLQFNVGLKPHPHIVKTLQVERFWQQRQTNVCLFKQSPNKPNIFNFQLYSVIRTSNNVKATENCLAFNLSKFGRGFEPTLHFAHWKTSESTESAIHCLAQLTGKSSHHHHHHNSPSHHDKEQTQWRHETSPTTTITVNQCHVGR